MNTFLISYDLGGPETSESYKNLITEIKRFGYWARPLESFWFVKTYESIDSVINKLKLYLDNNDKIVVMNVTNDIRRTLNMGKEISDWMQNNI